MSSGPRAPASYIRVGTNNVPTLLDWSGNDYHLLKSMVYFDDAKSGPMPDMLREVEWEVIKKTLRGAVRSAGAD